MSRLARRSFAMKLIIENRLIGRRFQDMGMASAKALEYERCLV